METLLSYNVDSIIDLNLSENESWFKYPGNADLLAELISRQTGLQNIRLSSNNFSSIATHTLLSKIADVINSIKLTALNLN